MTTTIAWFLIAFFCGALPFSVWVGRLALGKDIRQYGDHNPGSANVTRAGGKGWGAVAMLLDGFKGAIPVAYATFGLSFTGWPLVAVALAPILGHAYSPFLGFRGGKALAVTFGTWLGVSLYVGPMVLGLALAVFTRFIKSPGWTVLLGYLVLALVFALMRPTWEWWAIWVGSFALLMWKHRADLTWPPR